MRTSIFMKFDEITAKCFNQLKEIDNSYFMNGVAIDNAKNNKQDEFYIFMLINEYTCLKNVKYLINIFRFLADRPYNIKGMDDPSKILTLCKTTVRGMIKFSKRVSSINSMSSILYLSNPSDSGFANILTIFSKDLSDYLTKDFDLLFLKEDDAYLFDTTVGINCMIETIRILLVNGSYIGKRKNKFFIISQQLSNWLSTTTFEINDITNKNNI